MAERLGARRYAWSVGCLLNDQGLVRPLVTAAGETVFMCDSGAEVWLRPSDIGAVILTIPRHPAWRVSPGLHVIPGITSWAVTAARSPGAVSDRGASVGGGGPGCPHGATPAKEET